MVCGVATIQLRARWVAKEETERDEGGESEVVPRSHAEPHHAASVHHRADVRRVLQARETVVNSVDSEESEGETRTHRLRLERRELHLARLVDADERGEVADLVDLRGESA